MPTVEDLHFLWESNFELFGGVDPWHPDYDPPKTSPKATGEPIGRVVWKDGDPHIVPLPKEPPDS